MYKCHYIHIMLKLLQILLSGGFINIKKIFQLNEQKNQIPWCEYDWDRYESRPRTIVFLRWCIYNASAAAVYVSLIKLLAPTLVPLPRRLLRRVQDASFVCIDHCSPISSGNKYQLHSRVVHDDRESGLLISPSSFVSEQLFEVHLKIVFAKSQHGRQLQL